MSVLFGASTQLTEVNAQQTNKKGIFFFYFIITTNEKKQNDDDVDDEGNSLTVSRSTSGLNQIYYYFSQRRCAINERNWFFVWRIGLDFFFPKND